MIFIQPCTFSLFICSPEIRREEAQKFPKFTWILKYIIFLCVCMCAHMSVHVHVPYHTCEG